MEIAYAINDPGLLPLAEGQILRVEGGKGISVHCVRGQVWLTQLGVIEDFFLPGGASYASRGDGLILVNAWKESCLIRVRKDARDAQIRVGAVGIESHPEIDRHARCLRAKALGTVVAAARQALCAGWRRLARAAAREPRGEVPRRCAEARAPCYVVAHLRFKDRAAYDRYQAKFGEVFRRSGGTVLAADESPKVLEGDSAAEKVVILSFADRASALQFLRKPDYRRIAVDRRAGADAVVLLVRGLNRHMRQAGG